MAIFLRAEPGYGQVPPRQAIRERELDDGFLIRQETRGGTPLPAGCQFIPACRAARIGMRLLQPAHPPGVRSHVGGPGVLFGATPATYQEGNGFIGGSFQPFVPSATDPTRGIPGAPGVPNLRRGPINEVD